MGGKLELYVHLVWGTRGREPFVTSETEGEIHRALGTKCVELGCVPCAIGGTEDHVHVLLRLHPSVSVARLVSELKGFSSYTVTHRLAPGSRFQWQSGYAAFSLSFDDVPAVEQYVRNQKHHHALGAIEAELEST